MTQPVLELEKSLDKLPDGPARDGIVLMGGDFNLAKVDWEEDRIPAGCRFPVQAREMLRIAADQSLTQINHKSSRGENCLDLIFTNHPQLVKSPHVTPGISDHDIVVLDSDLKAQGQKTKPRNFFQYKKRDMTGLQEHIQQATDFYMSRIPETEPIGNVWAQFKDIICNAMTKFIPGSWNHIITCLG